MTSMSESFINKLSFDENGLIPAIAQDWLDGAVLMMAWMNRQSLEKTITTGKVHYWSRSRKELWEKGATSGHTQKLNSMRYDCDADAILLTVQQVGSIACHEGKRSCFFNEILKKEGNEISIVPADACSELFQTIESRYTQPDGKSYTNSLLREGDNKILKKIGEETAEFVMACKDDEPSSIANEAADLLFHLQVALKHHNVNWNDVLEVLASRRGKRRNKA
ncbi:bifunctional phosphoribosyl-AMP cyclohydrolase/phosphoribosyl-ATP diphosphatase HisIE [Prochlorococcus sp. MIT 1223]|uniref:bifunctional phosphoribosyl-AMP cyclohydrolase/phosphoribosyl-ATP diphosphatase HisIE n=1 Tax=Prochlorococcus sp. MIT 1223 TaxID=3096217 RepID=UPI002A765999|nr:bifunctional phosphoribosyl-AMP cyclohydrolase/phosphoribosyl-ATP diphosphatase HisIE [Prochlorococcus sp. MIT 1223]